MAGRARDNAVVTWLGSAAIVLFFAVVMFAIFADAFDIVGDLFR